MYFTDISENEKKALAKFYYKIKFGEKGEYLLMKFNKTYLISNSILIAMCISFLIMIHTGFISPVLCCLLLLLEIAVYKVYWKYWEKNNIKKPYADVQTLMEQSCEEYKVLHVPIKNANLLSYQEIISRVENVGIYFIVDSSDKAETIREKINFMKKISETGLLRVSDEEICICLSEKDNAITKIARKE